MINSRFPRPPIGALQQECNEEGKNVMRRVKQLLWKLSCKKVTPRQTCQTQPSPAYDLNKTDRIEHKQPKVILYGR